MTIEKWKDIRNNLVESDDVLLEIPKFKLEYGIKNLNKSLEYLGMEEAFSEKADFSKIREDIFISNVLHKAVIEVNEEESEAAAATVVAMEEAAIMEPITFLADRPFMFFYTLFTAVSNLRKFKWAEIKKRLFRFTFLFISLSILNYAFDYFFRGSNINYHSILSIAFGISFGLSFGDIIFLKNKGE